MNWKSCEHNSRRRMIPKPWMSCARLQRMLAVKPRRWQRIELARRERERLKKKSLSGSKFGCRRPRCLLIGLSCVVVRRIFAESSWTRRLQRVDWLDMYGREICEWLSRLILISETQESSFSPEGSEQLHANRESF